MSCPTMIVEASELECQLGKVLDECLLHLVMKCKDNLTSMQTLKYRILNCVANRQGGTFGDIVRLLQDCIPVHPDAAEELKKLCGKFECVQDTLAQDFVEQERLLKIIKYCFKNKHVDAIHKLLAMDGLNGSKLDNGPCLDPKRYLDNLRYGICGAPNRYEKPTFRGSHAYAVRKIYNVVEQLEHVDQVQAVYQVMCEVLKVMGGIELPPVEGNTLEARALENGVNVYREHMPLDHFSEWLETLKPKITTQSEEEESSRPKRKRVLAPPQEASE